MHTPTTQNDSPIAKGIKCVGIGKRGSKPLEPQLIEDILADLRSGKVPAIAQGAFFGALTVKGISSAEMKLDAAFAPGTLDNPVRLAEALAGDAPDPVTSFCARLLQGNTLNVREAEELGDFLFSDQTGEGARGMVASILRVRYETPEEYEGLLRSMHKTLEAPFRTPVPKGAAIVQLAEPFDGVDHSNMITPLIAQFIQRLNYRVVSHTGRNSGPKFGNNLLDLAKALRGRFLLSSSALAEEAPAFGWFVNQQNLSHHIDQWVERRHQTIKRPFLSTLERFLNPFSAHLHISSAFHPPYGEKMLTVCERAGYPGSIIVRNGLEGTLAFPLTRPAKLLCSARQANGTYTRTEMVLRPEEFTDKPLKEDEHLTEPSLAKNLELIETYHKQGQTSYEFFDMRIKVTCAGFKKAIEWLEQNISQPSEKD